MFGYIVPWSIPQSEISKFTDKYCSQTVVRRLANVCFGLGAFYAFDHTFMEEPQPATLSGVAEVRQQQESDPHQEMIIGLWAAGITLRGVYSLRERANVAGETMRQAEISDLEQMWQQGDTNE